MPRFLLNVIGCLLLPLAILGSGSCSPADEPPSSTLLSVTSTTASSSPPASLSRTTITRLFPAVDSQLKQLALDLEPREGVRVRIGGLREVPSDDLDPRKRLIEGELIIENRSSTAFAYGPDDFRLYVGPFQSQIEGTTASTDFLVQDAVLAPVMVGDHPFLSEGEVAPGETLHEYSLTWLADRGTSSSGLSYQDPAGGKVLAVHIMH